MFKSKNPLFTTLVFLTTLGSCVWFEQSDHEKITSNYEVGWDDLVSNRAIIRPLSNCQGCYETIIESYVFAIGHNDSFIIAKTHFGFDTTITYFHVIDVKRNEIYGGKKGVYVSLNEPAFDSLRQQLKISNIAFDMTYPENP